MEAEYDFRERPDPTNSGKPQPLYPRIVSKGTIKTKDLAEKVAKRTTFTPSEVEGIVGLLSETIAQYIGEGYSVELDELGYFSASLTSRPVMTKKEIRSASVSMKGVNFRVSKTFKQKLKSCELRRARYGFRKSEKNTPEERRSLLDNYLHDHPVISRKEYSQLTGLLKDQALYELGEWVKNGYLQTYGTHSHRVYLRRTAEKDTE